MTANEYKILLQNYIQNGGTAYLKDLKNELENKYPKKFWKDKLDWELKKLKTRNRKMVFVAERMSKETKQNESIGGVPLSKIKAVDSVPVEQVFINAPFSIRLLRTEYANLAKEQAAIHARLRMTPPTQRFSACCRIIEIAKTHDGIWDKIRIWRATGQEPADEISKSIVEIIINKHERFKTLRTYITKYSKKLKGTLTEDEQQRYEGYLMNYNIEIASIKKELNL
jgi:hypothetical protein